MLGAVQHSFLQPILTGAQRMIRNETEGVSIDFTDMSMVIRDAVTPTNNFDGNPNTQLTYTAPSAKLVRNQAGIYQSGTTLRTDYDVSDPTIIGLLVETTRANGILRSQELDNASWTVSNLTVAADSITSPDGTVDADTLTATTANGYITQNWTNANNAVGNVSVFLMRKTGTGNILLDNGKNQLVCATGIGVWQRFDLAASSSAATYAVVTNVVTVTLAAHNLKVGDLIRADFSTGTAADSNPTVATVPDVNTFTFAQVTGDTSGNVTVLPRNLRVTIVTNGDEVYAWQAQAEVASAGAIGISSPIVTTSATVTRNADNISLATTAFSYGATDNSAYGRCHIYAIFQPNDRSLVSFDNAASSEMARLRINSGTPGLSVTDGAVSQAVPTSGTAIAGAANERVAAHWATNDTAVSNDGGAVGTDVSATMPTPTRMQIGSRGDVAIDTVLTGHLMQILHVPRFMANAELQWRTVFPTPASWP